MMNDGVSAYMNEIKKEIDKYFDKKVKEFQRKTETNPLHYVDPYPEELYAGLSSPELYYTHSKDFDVMLFNRKLMEYKPAYLFNGQEFFDKEHKLPVSKGWEFHTDKYTNIKLSCWHRDKCKEFKMSWKEYFDKFLK